MITQMLKSLFKTNKKQKSTKAQKDEKLVLQKTKSNEIKKMVEKADLLEPILSEIINP